MHPTPAQLRALRRGDPALAAAMRRLGAFPGFPDSHYRKRTHYEALARAVVFQQLAWKAADTIWRRVVALTPGPRLAPPPELLKLPEDALRGAGLSRNKMLSLQDLARHVEDRSLPLRAIGRQPDQQVMEELVAVRGIGPWAAQMFLIFKLGRLDVLPTADLGVQEGLRRLDELEERPTPKQLEQRGAAWAPLRSVAAWYLWRLTDDD
ncbi:MAG: DNA-3-methyladenine glycosylase 2 family protein [Planctomycetes bacterium]|nr:DNA-3-methyladenine glycosylase 2 family protein [Planctomycetota bacterium]